MTHLLPHATTLTHLDLTRAYALSDGGVSQVLLRMPSFYLLFEVRCSKIATELVKLQRLSLSRCKRVSDTGLASLSALTALTSLDVSATAVTSRLHVALAPLLQLTALSVRSTAVTDTLFQNLPRARYLRSDISFIRHRIDESAISRHCSDENFRLHVTERRHMSAAQAHTLELVLKLRRLFKAPIPRFLIRHVSQVCYINSSYVSSSPHLFEAHSTVFQHLSELDLSLIAAVNDSLATVVPGAFLLNC